MIDMRYMDTHVILAYGFEKDPNHEKAVELVDKSIGDPFTSPYTLVELYCTVSRKIDRYYIPGFDFLEIDDETKARVIVEYSIRLLGLRICADDISAKRIKELDVDIFSAYLDAISLAPRLRMPTGDTIHIVYASRFHNGQKAKSLLTLDSHFHERKDAIEKETGILILTVT